MKTTAVLQKTIFAAIIALTFASCSDDDIDPQTTEERIRGVWKVNSIEEVDTNPWGPMNETYQGQPQDYFDFRSDGNVYQYWDGYRDTFSYRVADDQYIIEDVADTFQIITLTNNILVKRHTSGTYTFTENLYR